MNMPTNSLPILSDSELKFAQEAISKALTNQILSDGKPDFNQSREILKKFYDKNKPILDINGMLPLTGTWTPLATAAYTNNYRALQFLIENDADVNLSYDKLTYPLHLAAGKGHETCVLYLLKAGASVNTVDAIGRTALMRACERHDLKRTTIELFFNKSIMKEDLDLTPLLNNQSCLDIAREKGSPEIAKLLSYLTLKTKLIPKGTQEKRVKI